MSTQAAAAKKKKKNGTKGRKRTAVTREPDATEVDIDDLILDGGATKGGSDEERSKEAISNDAKKISTDTAGRKKKRGRGRPRKKPRSDSDEETAETKESKDSEAAEVLDEEYEVESIMYSAKHKGKRYFLVKWKNYSITDYTWEPAEHLTTAKDALDEFDIAAREVPAIKRMKYDSRPALSAHKIVDEMTSDSGVLMYKIAWKKHPVQTWEPSDSPVIPKVVHAAWKAYKKSLVKQPVGGEKAEDRSDSDQEEGGAALIDLSSSSPQDPAHRHTDPSEDNWDDITAKPLRFNRDFPGIVTSIRNKGGQPMVYLRFTDGPRKDEKVTAPIDVIRRTHPEELLDYLLGRLSFAKKMRQSPEDAE